MKGYRIKKKLTVKASNLHLINSQLINTLQTQVHIWNSNPGLRTDTVRYLLSITLYRKDPRTPNTTMWRFRKKMAGNKMKKCMRKYENASDYVSVWVRASILFYMKSLVIYACSFVLTYMYSIIGDRRINDVTVTNILLLYSLKQLDSMFPCVL